MLYKTLKFRVSTDEPCVRETVRRKGSRKERMFMIIFVFDNRNKGAQLNQPVKRPHQIQKEHNDSFVKICIDPHDETTTIKG